MLNELGGRLFLGAFAAIICGSASAALLQVGAPVAGEGGVAVEVRLLPEPVESVAGLQFDLTYDARRLAYVAGEAGLAAQEAEKLLHVNDKKPGRLRCVMAGFNQNAIAEGVVAKFRFSAQEGAGASTVTLENPILSDPFGSKVEVAVWAAQTDGAPAASAVETAPAGPANKAPFPLLVAAGVLTAVVVAGGVRARRGGAAT